MMLLAITIVPSLAILYYFVHSDKFREPNKSIYKVFGLGILICFPAYFANTLLISFFYKNTLVPTELLGSFLSAAIVEEGLKFLVLYYFVLKMKEFNEPMDGIVYGVTVSLGFATLENIFYVYGQGFNDPYSIAILRSISAIPAHALFGVFMGYFFMRYVFIKKKNNLLLSVLVPYFLHGYYNYFATLSYLGMFTLLIVGWFIAIRIFSKLKVKQKTKSKEYEKKL